MNALTLTNHATARLAQRSIRVKDADLIAMIGTEVDGGYLVREKDVQDAQRLLKAILDRISRLRGKRLVVADGQVITAYHASKTYGRRLLRNAHECDIYD